jgi:Rrf2 family protein
MKSRIKIPLLFSDLQGRRKNPLSGGQRCAVNPIIDVPEPLLLGLHALVALARQPGVCLSAKSVADDLGASEGHLAKVLQRLARAGYVEPVRGPGGGYRLVRQPDEIPMLPLVEYLGGPFELDGCGFSGCRGKKCLIGSMIDELTVVIREYMRKRTLGDLLRHYEMEPEIRIGVSLGGAEVEADSMSGNGKQGERE